MGYISVYTPKPFFKGFWSRKFAVLTSLGLALLQRDPRIDQTQSPKCDFIHLNDTIHLVPDIFNESFKRFYTFKLCDRQSEAAIQTLGMSTFRDYDFWKSALREVLDSR